MNCSLKTIALMLVTTWAAHSGAAIAEELEVTHWWTSGGEAAAVKVLADAVNDSGDTWVDSALAGSADSALPIIISRIIGGKPMAATQLNTGLQAEELIGANYMLDLTELAEREGWKDIIRPQSILDSCTINGRIYCVPVNIHSFQWMWISLDAYKKAGLDAPADWVDFVDSAPALRSAGITPLALGSQNWQINGLFYVLRIGLGGIDLYKKTDVERDRLALRGVEMQAVWQAFSDARDLDDSNNSIQNWNDATYQVINGTHAAQIMGDWAQGEFQLAGKEMGKEYDCLPGLGLVPALDTGGDAFYFPKLDDPAKTAAQLRMASTLISAPVQVNFNLKKGSLPVRADVDTSAANNCMQKGIDILENPENLVPSTLQLFDSDTKGRLDDLISRFWVDTSMSPEVAHDLWATIIEEAD